MTNQKLRDKKIFNLDQSNEKNIKKLNIKQIKK